MKLQDPIDLLTELGITLNGGYGKFRGRELRFLEASGTLQVGDDDFDRWANSIEWEFGLYHKKEQRVFKRWVENFKGEN